MHIKLNENENSGMLYAIAYCEDPDIYSEEFWGWDTESDVGYELMEFGSLIQDADIFDSLEAAEDRADDVLSSIFEDEVFIVGLDPYTPHNLTGFVKKITRPTMNENYCVYSSSNDGCYKEFTGTEDECNSWIENNRRRFPAFVNLKIQPESEPAKWLRDFDTTESKPMSENIKVGDKVKVSTPGNDYYDGRTGVVDFTEDGIVTVKFDDNNSPKLNNFDLNQVTRIDESKSIKESNTNPEDKFLFYFPYMGGPKTLNKERTIRQLEFELDNIKNNSGSGIAGRGFGVYCLESVDPDTGTVWAGRYSSKEFLNCLNESKSKSINEGWSGDTYKGYSILLNDDSINWDAEQVRLVWRILDKDGNKVGSVAGQANARKFVDDLLKNIDKQIEKKYLGARVEFCPFGNSRNRVDIDWGEDEEAMRELNGECGEITSLYVYGDPRDYSEEDQLDVCYCDVTLDNGFVLEEINGSCLELIKLKNESINESKSIKESSYKKGDRVELDNGMTGTVTKDFDWENEDQVAVEIDGTGEMRYPRSEMLRDLKENLDYVEVAYICDGFINFRVFGGGFKTSDALVSVEDEKGKRLRLTMGDVCEFYTWHDAKGNVIHEPGYIDDANLNENYVPEYGDEFPNMNAAMYVARSLVYHFVSDPDDAEKLYAKAESDGWESSELVALCDLIGDALEASNYHSEAKEYFYDKFPYWWAFDVSANDQAKMDELIESCNDDNQRMQLLIIAVNSLVLELD